MNELTNIMTVQLTAIENLDDALLERVIADSQHPKTFRELEEKLKAIFGCDDAKIISNQFFVNEKGGLDGRA